MASRSEPILTDQHYNDCNKCLELNAIMCDILSKYVPIFPHLKQFEEECAEFKRIASSIKRAEWPDRP